MTTIEIVGTVFLAAVAIAPVAILTAYFVAKFAAYGTYRGRYLAAKDAFPRKKN
jgi:hypothetical protein